MMGGEMLRMRLTEFPDDDRVSLVKNGWGHTFARLSANGTGNHLRPAANQLFYLCCAINFPLLF
jgi:hypothetical protein